MRYSAKVMRKRSLIKDQLVILRFTTDNHLIDQQTSFVAVCASHQRAFSGKT
jgi:hypothetical protein